MESTLAEIVIQNIEFFGLASDSEIHPDAAVRQLENVSSLLKELSEADLNSFLAHVGRRLEKLRAEGSSHEQLNFLENIRDNLGLGQ